MLFSRFLLGLQEASQMVVRVDADHPLHLSNGPDAIPSFVRQSGSVAALDPNLHTPRVMEDLHSGPGSQRLHSDLGVEEGMTRVRGESASLRSSPV